MRITLSLLLLLLAFNAHSQTAKFYKWVDDNGVTHYSARPPTDKLAESINIKTGESIAADKNEPERVTSNMKNTSSEKSDDGQQAPKTAQKQKDTKDPARCAKSRETHQMLVNNDRVRLKDDKTGEYRFVSGEQLEQWREKSTGDIRRYCP